MSDNYHVLDLFSGLGGFSAAFEDSDDWDVTTVDIDEGFGPDISVDVMNLRPHNLPESDVILASPPCTQFSMAASSLERIVDGKPQTPGAREAVALVYHTLGLIKALAPIYWFLENPQGHLRQVIGDPTGRVTYCQYGTDYMKPTDLWGNHPPGFTYRSCSYGENCHVYNTDVKQGGTGNMDDVDAYAQNSDGRSKVPYELSQAIYDAVTAAIEREPPKQAKLDEVHK